MSAKSKSEGELIGSERYSPLSGSKLVVRPRGGYHFTPLDSVIQPLSYTAIPISHSLPEQNGSCVYCASVGSIAVSVAVAGSG